MCHVLKTHLWCLAYGLMSGGTCILQLTQEGVYALRETILHRLRQRLRQNSIPCWVKGSGCSGWQAQSSGPLGLKWHNLGPSVPTLESPIGSAALSQPQQCRDAQKPQPEKWDVSPGPVRRGPTSWEESAYPDFIYNQLPSGRSQWSL